MLSEESSCVCMPTFRPVAPFLYLANVLFLALFFKFRKGCGHIAVFKTTWVGVVLDFHSFDAPLDCSLKNERMYSEHTQI